MTDRIGGFMVVLDHDMRTDDVQATVDAIRQLRGVLRVDPIVANSGMGSDFVAVCRERTRFAHALMDLVGRVNRGEIDERE